MKNTHSKVKDVLESIEEAENIFAIWFSAHKKILRELLQETQLNSKKLHEEKRPKRVTSLIELYKMQPLNVGIVELLSSPLKKIIPPLPRPGKRVGKWKVVDNLVKILDRNPKLFASVIEVVESSRPEIRKYPGIGDGAIDIIEAGMEINNLKFGMTFPPEVIFKVEIIIKQRKADQSG